LSRIKDFQKKLKQRTKFDLVRSIVQAFTLTVVAVVAVTVFIPKSPIASFDKIKAFSHEIIYQINVTDEDQVLENDQLILVAESQYERIEQIIKVGQNYGSFKNLRQNTEYQIKAVYDKGFGEEVLVKEVVNTSSELVAAITSVNEPDYLNQNNFYMFEITYGDTRNYSNFQIKYAIKYEDYSGEIYYNYLSLGNLENSFEINFYPEYKSSLIVILEATYENKTVELDSLEVKAPFTLYGSMYLMSLEENVAEVAVYKEGHFDFEIKYIVEVYKYDRLVNEFKLSSGTQAEHDETLLIRNLSYDTDYYLLFKAFYKNPDTLRDEHLLLDELFFQTEPRPEEINTDITTNNLVTIPDNLEASFFNIKTSSQVINYQVNIKEPDYIVLENELLVVLEDGVDYYEQVVHLGNNFNSFTNLLPNTEYTLKLIYRPINGEVTILEETVTTTNELVAAITNFSSLPAYEQGLRFYDVEVLYGDITGYSDWQIRTAIVERGFEEQAFYDTYLIDTINQPYEVMFYNDLGEEYHVILEALFDGSTVIVDEIRVPLPDGINVYLEYPFSVNQDNIGFSIYNDGENIESFTLDLEVYNQSILEQNLSINLEDLVLNSYEYIIYNLVPDTEYRFVLYANYIDQDSLREVRKVIGVLTVQTASNISPP
jgi:hypothetical protein